MKKTTSHPHTQSNKVSLLHTAAEVLVGVVGSASLRRHVPWQHCYPIGCVVMATETSLLFKGNIFKRFTSCSCVSLMSCLFLYFFAAASLSFCFSSSPLTHTHTQNQQSKLWICHVISQQGAYVAATPCQTWPNHKRM